MDMRFAKALAAGTVLALPLLSACGASTAPAGSSAAPAASSAAAAPSTSAAASPSPTATPVDEKKDVQAATSTFFKVAFALGGSVQSTSDWSKRVKPLMTSDGYDQLRGEATIDKTLTVLKTYGSGTRTVSGLVGQAQVKEIGVDKATVDVKFQSRLQKPDGDGWKTLKKSPVESGTLKLVKQGDTWLVDDAG